MQKYNRSTSFSNKMFPEIKILVVILFLFLFGANISFINAQKAENSPEISVAGIKLNDEISGGEFLSKFAPRIDTDGKPTFYFYNEYGTQVLKLKGFSQEKPHLIISAEVFLVGKSYRERHFFLKEISSFNTESGFFTGIGQSAKSILFAVTHATRPDVVTKKKGNPTQTQKEDKKETLIYEYNFDASNKSPFADNNGFTITSYTAKYEFSKDVLKKYSISVDVLPKN